jgi:integrase
VKMAVKVRERKGAWWVVIDHRGRRKSKRVGVGKEGKRAALAAAEKVQARLALGDTGLLDEGTTNQPVTFERYALRWLETHAGQACKFSTARIYGTNLKLHVFPILGGKPVAALCRTDCRTLITACREKGLSPKTLENISHTVSSVLTQAVEDELLPANPALRLGRYYRNGDHPKAEIHPLTRKEVTLFLETARQHAPRAPLVLVCPSYRDASW